MFAIIRIQFKSYFTIGLVEYYIIDLTTVELNRVSKP